MTDALTKLGQLEKDIIDAITSAQCETADDISSLFGIPSSQAIALLNNPDFLAKLADTSKAKLSLAQHSVGTNRVIQCLKSDNDQIAMKAYELISKITGTIKQSGVNVNITLESLLDGETEKVVKQKKQQNFLDIEFAVEELADN